MEVYLLVLYGYIVIHLPICAAMGAGRIWSFKLTHYTFTTRIARGEGADGKKDIQEQ